MTDSSFEINAPVAWFPAGLISWYDPGGQPLVMVTSWIALVGGASPRIRTAWYGRHNSASSLWTGGDFILNIPRERGLKTIRKKMHEGEFCLHAEKGLTYSCVSGVSAVAPLLLECAVQIECVGGRLIETPFDAELCGDVARIHRDGINLNPLDIPDICAINPLSP